MRSKRKRAEYFGSRWYLPRINFNNLEVRRSSAVEDAFQKRMIILGRRRLPRMIICRPSCRPCRPSFISLIDPSVPVQRCTAAVCAPAVAPEPIGLCPCRFVSGPSRCACPVASAACPAGCAWMDRDPPIGGGVVRYGREGVQTHGARTWSRSLWIRSTGQGTTGPCNSR